MKRSHYKEIETLRLSMCDRELEIKQKCSDLEKALLTPNEYDVAVHPQWLQHCDESSSLYLITLERSLRLFPKPKADLLFGIGERFRSLHALQRKLLDTARKKILQLELNSGVQQRFI